MDAAQSQTAGAPGAILRRYRTAAGLTQEALADQSGVSVYSISNLERDVGHIPRKDTIELLADALQLSPDERSALIQAVRRDRMAHRPDMEAAARERTCHVPLPPTPLIGREREVAALGALLQARTQAADANARLLTLVGPPGVGKTRLALEVAHACARDFRDDVAWVNLAPLGDAGLVAGAISQALGIRQQGVEPVEVLVQRSLHGKDLLLLLDNFEHLLPAASFLADLLATCPELHLMITSRAPLHVRGEQTVPIAPLAMPGLPDPTTPPALDALARIPSVELFVARARGVLPTFALTPTNAPAIAAICRRVDGLPLALELAAARLNVLSPATLLARLDHRLPLLTGGPHDLPTHQQTLRSTLVWSYDLLAANEQALFRRLAVFAGGAPLAAVAPVCFGTQEAGSDMLNGLSVLLDHHLLLRLDEAGEIGEVAGTGDLGGEPRYGMLETIREYAWEQLRLHDEVDVVERAHAHHYLVFAEAAEPKLRGPEQAAWLVWLEAEHDNLRTALRWSLVHEEVQLALRLVAALSRFWLMRGYLSEGRAWLDEVLALVRSEGAGHGNDNEAMRFALAQTLNGAGTLAHLQGDFAHATELYRQSLVLRRLLGDPSRIAATLNNLGLAAYVQGEIERAAAWWQESLDVLGEGGDARQVALALNHLGLFHQQRGEYQLARARYGESLAKMRAVGDTRSIAQVMGNLGLLARDEGDYVEATTLLEECLELQQALGDKQFMALALCELGEVSRSQGDYAQAQRLIEEGLGMLRALGDSEAISQALVYLGRVACGLGTYAQAVELFEEALRLCMAHSDRRGAILCVEGLASAACGRQRNDEAVRLLGGASALREALGTPLPLVEHTQQDHIFTELRTALGEAHFLAAWEAGRNLSFEETFAEALTEALTEAGMASAWELGPAPDCVPEVVPLHDRPT